MKPFFFGDSARPLFGLHHPPSGGAPRRWGVVICNPFGQEYLRAHRSLRELANRLAGDGFHVLRFDYYGCGDSAGDSAEASLEQWLLDISAAIAEVKEASASPKFALVGLRLGATLSGLLARQRGDVERLVLWDPILDGAAYLKELRTAHEDWLRDHAQRRSGPGEGEPLLEALGLPASSRPAHVPRGPSFRRPRRAVRQRTAHRPSVFPGSAGLAPPGRPEPDPGAPGSACVHHVLACERLPVKERTLLFGDAKSLVGIITEPAPSDADPRRPAVVLLNAGILHRVGPNRVHVRLARKLAEAGFLVMRFDYSGIGDSRPRADTKAFARSALAETRQCMDLLQKMPRASGRFLLAGICSGADNALSAATQDDRVVGVALIEPHSIPAPGFVLYQYRRKLLDPRSWWRLLRGRSELLGSLREQRAEEAGPAASASPAAAAAPAPVATPAASAAPGAPVAPPSSAAPEPAPDPDSIMPSRQEFVRQVRGLVDRGAGICFVYSSESPAYFNYLSLLRRELRRPRAAGRVRVQVLKQTDHVFTPLAVQDALVQTIRGWALSIGGPPRS